MSSKSTPNEESSAAPERMNPVFSLPQSRSESGSHSQSAQAAQIPRSPCHRNPEPD
jgi:hypothetical protein